MHYFAPKRCSASSKIMYKTRAQAQQAADRVSIEQDVDLYVYQCPDCGHWHLTHRRSSLEASDFGSFSQWQSRKGAHSRKRGYKPRHR